MLARRVFQLAFGQKVHRPEDGLVILFGSEILQLPIGGNLDIHAAAVGIQPRLVKQARTRPRNRFQVDVAAKAVDRAQFLRDVHELFHGVVGAADHRGTEEQPLDVVAAVELQREVDEFPGRKRRARDIVAAAIDAVGTIVLAGVAEQHLQQGNAPAIGRPRMAYARTAAAPEPALGRTAARTA